MTEAAVKLRKPNVEFDNTEVAFSYKTDSELYKALLLFRSVQSSLLVKAGPKLVELALKLHLPIKGLLKTYFFDQFCGGITLEDTVKRAEMLYAHGLHSTLDYGVEALQTDAGFDACAAELHRGLHFSAGKPQYPFLALKLTGLGSAAIMEKKQAGQPLTEAETAAYARMHARLDKLCAEAYALGQAVMIDAEETWFQDTIDKLAEEMMQRYNHEKPVVYTTLQLYRHDRYAYLERLVSQAAEQNFIAAVKLVRGAYLEKEAAYAKAKAKPSPLQPNKKSTDAAYDQATAYCLAHLQQVALCAGTHNPQSCKRLAEGMNELGLEANHPHVYFSQLYGMSDDISFNLAAAGYNVAKYLPYGPLDATLPYLFRRAQENSSVAGQSGRELKLIEQELIRRSRARRKKI